MNKQQVRRNLWGLTWKAASVESEATNELVNKSITKENVSLLNELKDILRKQSLYIGSVHGKPGNPGAPGLCRKKAIRRRKGGQHSVKKSVLFDGLLQ